MQLKLTYNPPRLICPIPLEKMHMELLSAAFRRTLRARFSSVLAASLVLGLGSTVPADYQWIGGDTLTGKWEDGANWERTLGEPNPIPVAGAQTRVGNNLSPSVNYRSTATIDATTGTANTGNLFISDNAGNFGTLIMNGGTLLPSTGFFSVGGNNLTNGGNGTFLLNNGTVILSSGSMNIGWASNTRRAILHSEICRWAADY